MAAETHIIEFLPAQGFDCPTSTTRRSFLAAAAVAGAVALSSVAEAATSPGQAEPSLELLELSVKFFDANEAKEEAGRRLEAAINAVRSWEAANPEPRQYDEDGNVNTEFAEQVSQRIESRTSALKTAGKMKALNAYQAAMIVFTEAAEDVCLFESASMADVLRKAAISNFADTEDNMIAVSVVCDLLQLERAIA
jgi:hypothetical protein